MAKQETMWRAVSLVLLIGLIVVVTSWATAEPKGSKKKDEPPKLPEYALQDPAGRVIVESNKSRFSIATGGNRGTDNEKIILWDTWDVANTGDVWMMEDPHTTSPQWKRIRFKK